MERARGPGALRAAGGAPGAPAGRALRLARPAGSKPSLAGPGPGSRPVVCKMEMALGSGSSGANNKALNWAKWRFLPQFYGFLQRFQPEIPTHNSGM